MKNPFENLDPDRFEIWEMLVSRDIYAFVAADWQAVKDDFIEEGFMGIDGQRDTDPNHWTMGFPDLESYREEWLKQAEIFSETEWAGDPIPALFALTKLDRIDIQGDSALAHKKFQGKIEKADGSSDLLQWQTFYRCRKDNGKWKIAGFMGYLPYPLSSQQEGATNRKKVPAGASQHVTAGPYSPVLEIDPQRLVVISGQAALDQLGNVIGDTIEEQTVATLENCRRQLNSAGCNFSDVFKVNVFLTDLDLWPRFNTVYQEFFPDPKPVRTAVQTPLLMTFLVEIELWAVK